MKLTVVKQLAVHSDETVYRRGYITVMFLHVTDQQHGDHERTTVVL